MTTRSLMASAFAGALAASLVACSAGTGTTPPMTGASPSSNSGSPPGNAQMAATVTIRNFKYIPENVTIKKGGTITWKNEDAQKHDATPKSTGFTATRLLAQNESSDPVTFSAVGSVDYFCSVHPNMLGKVTVVE